MNITLRFKKQLIFILTQKQIAIMMQWLSCALPTNMLIFSTKKKINHLHVRSKTNHSI